MSESKRNVPKLRFPGFTEAWEQRKLGEMVERVTRKNENLESALPLTISAQYGLVDQVTYFDKQVASNDLSGYYLLEKGEFAYNKSTSKNNPWGAVKRLERYEKGCVSTLYIVFKARGIYSDFLVAYYDTDRWHREVRAIATEGARNHGLLNVAPGDWFETGLRIPSNEQEQARIGSFFRDLDDLITLHQRKLDHLKLQKRGLLQKMFPRDGSDRPEIRFPGFTDAWEQRKLGEIANRYDNLRIPITASERVFGSTPYYGANGIQDYVEGFTHQGEFVLIAEDGASDLDNYPTMCINGTIWVNNHAHVIQAKTDIADNQYISWSLKRCDIKPLLTGGTRAKLNAEVLMNIEMVTPSRVEQAQIGSFFRDLDTLITLHQRKLDHLKLQKKALLQQMFI